MPFLRGPVADLLAQQSGVVTRAQLLGLEQTKADVRRLLRRRELAQVHPGVYVDHTGDPTWLQQAWAGVLAVAPAALCHASAIRAADGPGRAAGGGDLHVAVASNRHPAAPPGVRLHHLVDLDTKVLWNLGPPRVRIEQAVLDVAAEARSEMAAIAVLADAVQSRRTTAARLQRALEGRSRIARRGFLEAVLADVAAGACSLLEHGYLDRVERAHGLPEADRQVRDSLRGPVFRDVEHRRERLVVELDGRLFHDSAQARDRDLDRDLDAAVAGGRLTVRLGWGQVFDRACATAVRVGALLQRRGWTGAPHACPVCPQQRYDGLWLPSRLAG